MPMLSLALLALSVPAAQAADLHQLSRDEAYCVYDQLDEDGRTELAKLVITTDDETIQNVFMTTAEALAECVETWKWTEDSTVAGVFYSAAEAGKAFYAAQVAPRLSTDRLDALFLKLDQADRIALTFDGTDKLSAQERQALAARVRAVLAREGVAAGDLEPAEHYLACFARSLEMLAEWGELLEQGKR
ncbi:hypothetical protein ACFQ1E_19115 [Sphingomonas canadensis]|uniref:Uncharacterized protein n=1 Tax=Sphingomonas canadensis TaxID=1219257 RepID=A0ABW3HG01_9SPHN|nr:hypothetical protein [Sphingomonas canadensis]MCW3838206.1 hypothetical protein [Sphingomonas canadensis]